MFEIIAARGVPLMSNGHSVDIDYAVLKLQDYPRSYASIYFTLSYNGQPLGLNYNNIPTKNKQLGNTLREYLDGITLDDLPDFDSDVTAPVTIKANYFNLWDFKPQLRKCNVNYHIDTILEEEDLTDADLSTRFDNYALQDNCLITVAGMVHRLYVNADRAVIMNATATLNSSKESMAGLIDFSPLGGLECVDITSDMLYVRNSERYITGVYVKLPVDLNGKTPMLVLAGKLITHGIVQVVSDRVVKIDLSNLDIIGHYHELMSRTKLDLPVIKTDGGGVMNSSLTTDAYISALLTGVMSFMVLIKSTDVMFGRTQLHSEDLPGIYQVPESNTIVMSETGFLMDYVSTDNQLVKCSTYLRDNVIRNTGGSEGSVVSISQSYPQSPKSFARAHALHITKPGV